MLILVALILLSYSNLAISVCPNGSYSVPTPLGSSYDCVALSTQTLFFLPAEEACNNQSGHLFPIPNQFVNAFITDLISAVGNPYYWIGISNIMGGVWKNVYDGSNVTYFNWAPGHPMNSMHPLCAYIHPDGLWISSYCSSDYNFNLCGIPDSGGMVSEEPPNVPQAKTKKSH